MNSALAALLEEIRIWLGAQPKHEPQSEVWYALRNLQGFAEDLGRNPTRQDVERAILALKHHIADQYDWEAEYCKTISGFCERADKIRKTL